MSKKATTIQKPHFLLAKFFKLECSKICYLIIRYYKLTVGPKYEASPSTFLVISTQFSSESSLQFLKNFTAGNIFKFPGKKILNSKDGFSGK